MALFKKAEFAAECGVSRAHVSMAIKRTKVIVGADGMIDSENPINRLYKDSCAQNAAEKGKPEKVAETSKKRAPLPGKSKAASKKPERQENPELQERISEKFTIDRLEKQSRIAKINLEAELMQMKQRKLSGQLMPTDMVFNLIRQLSQSMLVGFSNGLDALVTDVAKSAKLDRNEVAEMRKRVRSMINKVIDNSIDDAKRNVDNIVAENSQQKAA